MEYKKILITGGAGFIGSNIAIKLKENNSNIKVIALDNLRRRGSELNINRLKEHGISFKHGDIRNYGDLESIGKIDLIIECSAEPSVLAGYGSSPRYAIDTNLLGAVNCLELARKHKAGFIFFSTSRVYPMDKINSLKYIEKDTRFELDPNQSMPKGLSKKGISEEFALEGVRSFYGATKLSAELLLKEYINGYGIKGIINRCGVIAGPWQMGKIDQGFVALWVAAHIFGKKLIYVGFGGKGKQVRDVLHIDDLYDVLELQFKEIDIYNGNIYNIGGGDRNSISLKELTSLCERITGNRIRIGSINKTREADIKYYITDYTKLSKLTGWKPKRNLVKIIKDMEDWVSANKGILETVLF